MVILYFNEWEAVGLGNTSVEKGGGFSMTALKDLQFLLIFR